MPKAARISLQMAAATASSRKSDIASTTDSNPLVAIAIFSGIGLLVSLVAMVAGVPGAWY